MFVIAVCREWVVREDNALAQQLQSQESEFFLKKSVQVFTHHMKLLFLILVLFYIF